MTEQPFRQPPHNLDAEQALLGAILINNDAHDRVSNFLKPDHFFDRLHQKIFETMVALIANGKRVTPITIKTFFDDAEPIDTNTTAIGYLGKLAANATSVINARDYGQTIYDLAIRRHLIVIGEDMVNAAYSSPVDFPPKEQIEEVEARLFKVAETGKYGEGFHAFKDASSAAVTMASSARKRGGGISGLATGFLTVDAKTGGLQSTDLDILAGRPAMGKTALATNIAFNVARAGTAVGFFSLEMSKDQLATRMLSEQIGVSSERIRRGQINDGEERRLIEADRELSSIPLFIDQTGGISIAQLAARARKLKRQKGVGLIVVDYLQLLSGSSMTRGGGRVHEVSEITTGLKALAKEFNLPILALSQLSRNVEHREGNRPQLSDLRESGSIEQDADVVMFVFREEYYLERSMPGDSDKAALAAWRQRMAEVAGKAEVDIAKQRHGPVGRVLLQFDASLTRFSDLAKSGHANAYSAFNGSERSTQ